MSYANPMTIERARAILEAALKGPSKDRIDAMIARGIIDEQGQVIHQDAEQSNGKKSNGSAAKKKKPASGKKS